MKRLALLFTLAVLAIFIVIPARLRSGIRPTSTTSRLQTRLRQGTFQWDTWARYNEDFPRGRRVQTRLFGALFDKFEFGMSWGHRPSGRPARRSL